MIIINSKVVVSFSLFALSTCVQASPSIRINEPYAGVEIIQTNQNYLSGYGKDVFYKNPQDYSIFGGFKFYDNLGAEFGYEFQPNRNMNTKLNPGDIAPGNIGIGAGQYTVIESSISTQNPYVAIFAEQKCALSEYLKVKFQELVGLSATHVKARTGILATQAGISSQAAYNASVRTYSKTKLLPVIKLTATFSVTESLGLRVSANYRNMSALKITPNESGNALLKFKDTFGIGLGITYSFID